MPPETNLTNSPKTHRDMTLRLGWLVIAIGVSVQLLRVIGANSREESTPFFGANDRSRWCTIAALVDENSYEIDSYYELEDKRGRRPWFTIDRVQHRGLDGFQHMYSSKPPLLPTLYSSVYFFLNRTLGWSIVKDPYWVARVTLICVNVIPLAICWAVFFTVAQRHIHSPFWLILVTLFVVSGTFLSTFANTINNHLPAAIAITASTFCWWKIPRGNSRTTILWPIATGFSAAFAVTCELPSLSWATLLLGLTCIRSGVRPAALFVIGTVPIIVAFFGANYLAHGTWRPAYSQRSPGQLIATVPSESADLETLIATVQQHGLPISRNAILRDSQRNDYRELWDRLAQTRYAIIETDPGQTEIRQWGDWYDYPGTYWKTDTSEEGGPRGVDRGEPSRLVYLFHMLIGHHGILSLTPFWLIALIGSYFGCISKSETTLSENDKRPFGWLTSKTNRTRDLTLAILITTTACLTFYVMRPLHDRNYGGVATGLRWSFWLIPLWIFLAIQFLRSHQPTKWQMVIAIVVVAISIFSSTYAWNNPWTHPWIFDYAEKSGWIHYP